MGPLIENGLLETRRHFFGRSASAIGVAALASLFNEDAIAAPARNTKAGGLPGLPHFGAKAKRVIYLFQSGAPSQMDLFDYKPKLADVRATELPDSVRQGQRLTGMTSSQDRLPIAPSIFKFKQHGQCGAWVR